MSTLTYDFRVIGLDAIDKAFSAVEARVTRHNQTVTRAMGGRSVTSRAASPEAAAMRAAQRQEREAEKAQRQVERARLREVEKGLRAEERMRVQSARESARRAREALKTIERDKATQQRKAEAWRREMGSRAGGTISGIGKGALAATGLASGAWLTAATYGAVRQEDAVRRLLINSRGAGQKQAMSYGDLSGRIRGASIANGVSEGDIAEGLGTFVARTGDLSKGVEIMGTLAQTAQATGASFSDLASVSADLSEKFDIKSVEEMRQALAMLTFQGKAGAFEIKDMATQFPALAARMSSLGMSGMGGLAKTGALAQIIRASTKSPEQTAFAMEAMPRQLVMKASKMESGEAFGGTKMNVFTDATRTKLRDITELIPEVLKATGGDMTKLQDIFGEQGMMGITPFLSTFQRGGGGAAGAQAVSDQIKKAAGGGSWNEIQQDAKDAMQSTASQLESLNTQLKAAVETDLLPALKELVPAMVKLAPYASDAVKGLAKLVDFFANHPIAGLGALMAASVTKELASAKIGDVLKNSFEKSANSGNLLAGLTIAAATFAIGTASIDVASQAAAKGNANAATLNARMGAVNARAQQEMDATGSISDETRKEMLGIRSEIEGAQSQANTGLLTSMFNSTFGTGVGVSGYLKGSSTISSMNDTGASAEEGRMNAYLKLSDAADKLTVAADKIAQAGGGASPAGTLNRGQSPTNPG